MSLLSLFAVDPKGQSYVHPSFGPAIQHSDFSSCAASQAEDCDFKRHLCNLSPCLQYMDAFSWCQVDMGTSRVSGGV